MKAFLHRTLQSVGLDIVRHPQSDEVRRLPVRRARWLRDTGTTLVLDVGANVGQYGSELRGLGHRGRIVSFEPQMAAFRELERAIASDPNWRALNVALGREESVASMNVAGYSESSSLLPMEERHVKAYPPSAYVGKEQVRVMTDSLRPELVRGEDTIRLKLDVQGYEMTVLAGATATLDQVAIIEMELSVMSLYKGAPLMCDSVAALRVMGFELIGIEEAFMEPQSGHVLQVNGVFRRQ